MKNSVLEKTKKTRCICAYSTQRVKPFDTPFDQYKWITMSFRHSQSRESISVSSQSVSQSSE